MANKTNDVLFGLREEWPMSDTETIDEEIRRARQEDCGRTAMLALVFIYSVGFFMGGIVCGIAGFLIGRL